MENTILFRTCDHLTFSADFVILTCNLQRQYIPILVSESVDVQTYAEYSKLLVSVKWEHLKDCKIIQQILNIDMFLSFSFRLTINALAQKLNAYWKEKTSQENFETSAIVRPILWVVNLEYKSIRGNVYGANGRNGIRWCFSHKEV